MDLGMRVGVHRRLLEQLGPYRLTANNTLIPSIDPVARIRRHASEHPVDRRIVEPGAIKDTDELNRSCFYLSAHSSPPSHIVPDAERLRSLPIARRCGRHRDGQAVNRRAKPQTTSMSASTAR